MKIWTTCITLLMGVVVSISSLAQVGFNNPNPDPSSILDLTANDKGLLVPRMTTAQRQAIGTPAQSLLVYDTNLNGFFFYQGGNWYSLNEWVRAAGSNTVSLSGNASVTGDISSSTMNMTNLAAANNISTSSFNAGAASVSGNLSAGSLSVAGFSTNALVPSGVIVMWSGSTAAVPSGWALCNGANGTPDLRDRFIAGAGGAYAVGTNGGQNSVSLSLTQIPNHNHVMHANGIVPSFGFISRANNAISEGGGAASLGFSFSVDNGLQTGFAGGGAAHENRPLFYSLAFIMKL